MRIELIGIILAESVSKRFFKLLIDGPLILIIGMPNSSAFSLRTFVTGKKLVKPSDSIFFRMFGSLKLTIGMPNSDLTFTLSGCIFWMCALTASVDGKRVEQMVHLNLFSRAN